MKLNTYTKITESNDKISKNQGIQSLLNAYQGLIFSIISTVFE